MNPSTSLGTRSNVGMAKPSPPVRQAGNIGSLLMIRGVCRRKVPSGGAQVKSKCRCRDKFIKILYILHELPHVGKQHAFIKVWWQVRGPRLISTDAAEL